MKNDKPTVIVAFAIAVMIFLLLDRIFNGVGSVTDSVFGEGADEKQGKRHTDFRELYDANSPDFADATPEQVRALIPRAAELAAFAIALKQAGGTFNDNEAAIVSVFAGLRSRFELLWLNRAFTRVNEDLSMDAGITGNGPKIGPYLDGIISNKEWAPIVSILDKLRKY